MSITDSRYGKSEHGVVIVGAVTCSGSEDVFDDCDIQLIPIEDGRQLVKYVNVSGVVCGSGPSPNIAAQTSGNTGMSVAVAVMAVMLVTVVAVLIGYVCDGYTTIICLYNSSPLSPHLSTSVILFARIKHKKQGSLSISSHHMMPDGVSNPMGNEQETASLDDKIITL